MDGASTPTNAGSETIGILAGSADTMLGGQPALGSQTIFSGDRFRVGDGAAEIMLAQGARLILGAATEIALERKGGEIEVHLAQGHLGIHAPRSGPRRRNVTLMY